MLTKRRGWPSRFNKLFVSMSAPLRPTFTPRTAYPDWVTPELLEHTQRLWSRQYGRAIDTAEAVDLLVRVGQLIDVLNDRPAARVRADGSDVAAENTS